MKGKLSLMWRAAVALVLVLSFSLVMAVPVSAVGSLTVTVDPTSGTAGQTTTYTIGFDTVTSATLENVHMEFASGFDVSSAGLAQTATGIGAGAVTVSGQIITYTVTTPAVIADGVTITIVLSGIVNHSTAATYSATVTTRDTYGVTIDQGTDASVVITACPLSFLAQSTSDGAITTTAGTAFAVKLTAKDASAGGGSAVTSYTGAHLITFTSTGTGSSPNFEMLTFSSGVATTAASFILTDTGQSPTITTEDEELEFSGTSAAITINPGAVDYLTMTGAPTSVTAGVPFSDDIIVTAYDACGNVKTNCSDSVAWTSTDTAAVLPSAQSLSSGTYTFTGSGFTLKTTGSKTITATDATARVAKSSDSITVSRTFTNQLTVVADPTSITADGTQSSTITASACDEFDNVDTSYTAAVTFTTSLGTLSDVSTNFVSGVATATLTSTHTGTATIKATSGSFEATATVVLGSDVWVDGTNGHDSNPGTVNLPVATIQAGIDAAGIGGTVNVLPGTYDLSSTYLTANTTGLTLQSTGGAAVTIIDADSVTGGPAIEIHASDVTLDGFTVAVGNASGIDGIWIWYGTEGVTVQNNIITEAGASGIALTYTSTTAVVTDATVSGNVITDCVTGIDVGGCLHDSTISNNTITGCDGAGRGINFAGGFVVTNAARGGLTEGNTITGNTITDNACMGIYIKENTSASGTLVFDDNLIEGNTISGNTLSGIQIQTGLTITNLTITGNDITSNTPDGILIASWGSTNAINYNNIYGNDTADSATLYDINNGTATSVDAENNWWGSAVESAIEGLVSTNVDCSPWLDAPYPYGGSTTGDGDAIILVSGWNLISLSLIPTDSTIATVLADLITAGTVEQVRTYDQGAWPSWASTEPHGDLTIMKDGPGYWVEMNATDDLGFTGAELPVPPQSPPSYDVYIGWNMIGFKSLTTQTAEVYLGEAIAGVSGVGGTMEAIYGYSAAASAYFIPGVTSGHTAGLEPGYGYWLAVNANGTIYP